VEHAIFILKHGDSFYGPFIRHEADLFASKLGGAVEVYPLFVPRLPEEEAAGPMEYQMLSRDSYRAHIDGFKIDTSSVLAGITREFYFARRDQRVLTAREMRSIWDCLSRVGGAVESLIHYVDLVVADPIPENLAAMRKALWRNRDSDDVDPHYQDRFW
jgi:hypothetical protein